MSKIYFELNNEKDIFVQIYDDEVSQIFYQQQKNLLSQKSIIPELDDPSTNTFSYFKKLIKKAKKINAVDWTHYEFKFGEEHYPTNQQILNEMHKEIEVIGGIKNYERCSNEQIDIFNKLHFCLHNLENKEAFTDYREQKRNILLTRYYAGDDLLSLIPEHTKFKRTLEMGEIFLDYCYVGKEPILCAIHNDNSILEQTCKMIDRVSITWKLCLHDEQYTSIVGNDFTNEDVDNILRKWFYENETAMNNLNYSLEKIINHTGYYSVGKIDDSESLEYLKNSPNLEMTKFELID